MYRRVQVVVACRRPSCGQIPSPPESFGTQERKPMDTVNATIIAFAIAVIVLICGFAAMGVATMFH